MPKKRVYTPKSKSQSVASVSETIPPGTRRARVVRAHGLWYEVRPLSDHHADAPIIATMKGQLKKTRVPTDIVAVGDWVWISDLPDNEAIIEYVEPRTRSFVRTARHTRDTEQVILANADQVVIVFAVVDPEPHIRMLDRFIILAETQRVPVQIVVNKADLSTPDHIEAVFGMYHQLYPLHFVSAANGSGIDALRATLSGKTTAIVGPSGVGKSSLLNAIDPDHRRETGEVSLATGKGKHTTVGSRLYEIADDTWVADTPGMRALAMHAIDATVLDTLFIEMRPYLGQCFYQDCTHVHEPDCAVRQAVEQREISLHRYESYVSLRTGQSESSDQESSI